MTERSPYQDKLIKRYYDQRDHILLARLSEIVTELYLAETDKKRASLWSRAEKAMEGLKIPPSIQQHIVEQKDPKVLARNLQGWLGKDERSKTAGKKK
jgi:hypothetical protein